MNSIKRIDNVLGEGVGWIELQGVMGNDMMIVDVARTSYLGQSQGTEKDAKLLRRLWKDKHMSPFEFGTFIIRMEVPLFVQAQIVRHRAFGFNIQSYRYVPVKERFYYPVQWRLQDKVNKQGGDEIFENNELANKMLHIHVKRSMALYNKYIEMGISREMARMVIPQNVYSVMVTTCDLRNLLHFCDLRTDPHAQWETRQYANLILHEFIKSTFPIIYEAFTEDKDGDRER